MEQDTGMSSLSERTYESDHFDRVRLMASGDAHWDLSEKDTAALNTVLREVERLREQRDFIANSEQALCQMVEPLLCNQTHYGRCVFCSAVINDQQFIEHYGYARDREEHRPSCPQEILRNAIAVRRAGSPRDPFREIGTATAEMITCIQNWLGAASTREAAMESIWRVSRLLQRHGFQAHPQNELEWRGVIIKAMDEAGIGLGDDDKIRLRTPDNPPWQHANGAILNEALSRMAEALVEFVAYSDCHCPWYPDGIEPPPDAPEDIVDTRCPKCLAEAALRLVAPAPAKGKQA
jgi:hypothetical protein